MKVENEARSRTDGSWSHAGDVDPSAIKASRVLLLHFNASERVAREANTDPMNLSLQSSSEEGPTWSAAKKAGIRNLAASCHSIDGIQ